MKFQRNEEEAKLIHLSSEWSLSQHSNQSKWSFSPPTTILQDSIIIISHLQQIYHIKPTKSSHSNSLTYILNKLQYFEQVTCRIQWTCPCSCHNKQHLPVSLRVCTQREELRSYLDGQTNGKLEETLVHHWDEVKHPGLQRYCSPHQLLVTCKKVSKIIMQIPQQIQ